VRLILFVAAAVLCSAAGASAQTEGRVSIGASITMNTTTDGDVGNAITGGPLIRLNPRKGWRIAGALNWFRADLDNPAGGGGDFAKLRARPLMAGIGYTTGQPALLTTFSIVAGPSFNKAEFTESYSGAGEAISAENSFAVRPGVGVTWSVAPRVGIVGFGGYLINRPDIVYRNRAGGQVTDHWKADALVLSIGVVYSVF
jgi:hypothetical protein